VQGLPCGSEALRLEEKEILSSLDRWLTDKSEEFWIHSAVAEDVVDGLEGHNGGCCLPDPKDV
jgi:hypothetical protein